MGRNGFSLVEILIAMALIALVAMIATKALNPTPEARVIACQADLRALWGSVELMRGNGPAPTWDQIQAEMGHRWDKHYHYIPNNDDKNSGHGNDIDYCDEQNPGKSTDNRNCLNLDFVIVCDHDHSDAGIKYNAVIESWYTQSPLAIPLEPIQGEKTKKGETVRFIQQGNGHEFLNDIMYWRLQDPDWPQYIDGIKFK
jgi:prepilin-type N-terminal cleavage/methylation domain-containing protein